jgi:EmrB/QacA subfamily drug resistance transporter
MSAEESVEPMRAGVTAAPPRHAQDALAARPHGGTLLVLLAGSFIASLDFFIVNVAIPSIQRDLSATSAAIQFIVAGFAIGYGSGLIIGGRIGDIFGRRRMYMLGMTVFTLSSVVCGVAPSAAVLVGARVVQGLAAAVMSPQVLSILGTLYTGEARARAFNAYGVVMGVSAVFGQLIGGLLIHGNVFGWGWRNCFLINLPIGIVALSLVPRLVPETRAPGRPRLDIGGMVLIALALVAVVLPLIEGRQQGWPPWAWLSLAAAVPLFALFTLYERGLMRRGSAPLIDLGLFRERAFTAGLLAQLTFFMGMAAFFLVFALFVQFGRGLDALGAGLIFIAIGAGYMATSNIARLAAVKMGRQVIAAGALLRVVGLSLLVLTVAEIGVSGSIAWLVPALVIDGAGMGLALAPLATTVLSRVTPSHAGAASGVLNTGLQMGNALGVAVIGVIFYGLLASSHGVNAYPHAFQFSLLYLIAVEVVLAVLVQFLPRTAAGT